MSSSLRSRSALAALNCHTRSRIASNSKSCAADWHTAEADAKLRSERTSSCSATIVISSAGNDVSMHDSSDTSFGALRPFRTRCCSLARHHMAKNRRENRPSDNWEGNYRTDSGFRRIPLEGARITVLYRTNAFRASSTRWPAFFAFSLLRRARPTRLSSAG